MYDLIYIVLGKKHTTYINPLCSHINHITSNTQIRKGRHGEVYELLSHLDTKLQSWCLNPGSLVPCF